MFWRLAAIACFAPGSLFAQEWACDAGICIEVQPRLVETLSGKFAGGRDLSIETDSDRVAALEQQSWREFQYLIGVPVKLSAKLSAQVADDWNGAGQAPKVSLHISDDGEQFDRVTKDTIAQLDQLLSVVVAQGKTPDEETALSYYPYDYTVEIFAQRVRLSDQADNPAGEEILLPLLGDELGCEALGCGDTGDTSGVEVTASVLGEANPNTVEADQASSAGGEELARELQTELKRIGCYDITVDGLWGPGSRKAMKAFNAAIGTAHSTERPSAKALVDAARQTGVVCNN